MASYVTTCYINYDLRGAGVCCLFAFPEPAIGRLALSPSLFALLILCLLRLEIKHKSRAQYLQHALVPIER